MAEHKGRYQGKRLISGRDAEKRSRGSRAEGVETAESVRETTPAETAEQEELLLRTLLPEEPETPPAEAPTEEIVPAAAPAEKQPEPPAAEITEEPDPFAAVPAEEEVPAAKVPEEEKIPAAEPEEKQPEAPAAEGSGEKQPEPPRGGFWKDYGYLVITALAVLVVFRVLLQLAYVPSGSMESVISRDSLLVSWQLPYLVSDPEPQRGDVVTLWNAEENKLLVKRVVGLPGEEITFKEGCVCVNGQKLEEPYLDQQGVTKGYKQSVYQVPEGCVLLLGDNRGSSKDSRYWEEPYISIDNIRARVMVCVPLTRWHNIPLPQFGRIHLVG